MWQHSHRLRSHRVSIVIDYAHTVSAWQVTSADTRFFANIFAKTKNFAKPFFASSYLFQVEIFDSKKCQKPRDTVPLNSNRTGALERNKFSTAEFKKHQHWIMLPLVKTTSKNISKSDIIALVWLKTNYQTCLFIWVTWVNTQVSESGGKQKTTERNLTRHSFLLK